MSTKRGSRWCVLLTLALLTSCALMQKPQPLTTLQLQFSNAAQAPIWPTQIELGAIRATAALQGSRLLVVKGAVLMQHARLRWAAAPATMLDEQLRLLRHAPASAGTQTLASLQLWLTQFQITVASERAQSVTVAAVAELTCVADASRHRMPTIVSTVELPNEDAQAVAAAFAAATEQLVSQLGAAADIQAARCGVK